MGWKRWMDSCKDGLEASLQTLIGRRVGGRGCGLPVCVCMCVYVCVCVCVCVSISVLKENYSV